MRGELEHSVGYNVFLDFLNRDSRQIFDLHRLVSRPTHLKMLGHVLNLAVFVTRDHCIMPPGFLAEDELVRDILDVKRAFREERLILLPIRESLDQYWAKKEREYAHVRRSYSGLFTKEGHQFVEKNISLLIDRPFMIGSELVRNWERAPDTSRYWKQRLGALAPSVIEMFRRVPRYLAEDGEAVTWESISMCIPEVASRHPEYRRLVQHIYLGLYLERLDLRVLTKLPYARDDFGLGSDDLFYNYDGLRTLIEPSGLWDQLLNLSAREVVALRKTPGYFEFRRAARRLIDVCQDYYDLKRHMALPKRDLRPIIEATREAANLNHGQLLLPFEDVDETQIEAFSNRLARIVSLALGRHDDKKGRPAPLRTMYETFRAERVAGTVTGGESSIAVGIFAALPEERKIVARELGFRTVPGDTTALHGLLAGGMRAILYGGTLMGRVPAAVETAYVLSRHPRIITILVVGLAGGFPEAKVRQGHILIPFQIADLASRKISSVDNVTDSRVRPQAWEIDQRLGHYVETQMGDDWLNEACDNYNWPEDRRPTLRVGGTIVCLDEVVADEMYRAQLQDAWGRQLLGVEMESGGVVAAARKFRGLALPVFQIRAVSDSADPAKSDDRWRTLGMQTISCLIRRINWNDMLDTV